jgi:transglutaminase-like putative cysteine protease
VNFLQRVILPSLALALVAVAPLHADVDRWYEIQIAESPCGFLHETVVEKDDLVRTMTEEQFVVTRGGRRVSIEQSMSFEETSDGNPLRARVEVNAGGEPSVHLYEFTADGVTVTIEQRGRLWTKQVEMADMDWLTPNEAVAFVEARITAGAKRIAFRTVEPAEQMNIVEVRSELLGHERREIRGRSLELGRWRTRTSSSPLELIELRTSDGTVVSAEVDLGIGAMKMELVDRERAQAALSSTGPELLSTTVVPVDGMPARSEQVRTARYLVRARGVDSPMFPDSGGQRVHARDDGAVEIELDASRGSAATEDELEDPAFREPSALVDSDDPEIDRFTRGALRQASDDAEERAEALRRSVRRHISRKDFGTAFASASDAVRDKSGDCTEHAVLLTAALRADGIPARVATGLVHARVEGAPDGGFAWHMWTQALIDGEWIDLDATRSERFDGGHLLVSTSALERGAGEQELSKMLLLLGRLEIQVLEVDGERGR